MHTLPSTHNGVGVEVRGVRRDFGGGVVALDGIDLNVAAGEFVAILGPSGCGKSTLLRLIAGLDVPTEGAVSVRAAVTRASDSSDPWRSHRIPWIAYVFQDAHLLPWRSVMQNVALPLELRGVARGERTTRAASAIEAVGLADFARKYPAQLSGGMRMRVSLARAMVTSPTLLLLDEPFAALDEITRQRLDEQLLELWRASKMTVIFVTHSTSEAVFLSQRAVVLSKRPGRIVEDRAIELPQDRTGGLRATAEFARETRFIYDALERGEARA